MNYILFFPLTNNFSFFKQMTFYIINLRDVQRKKYITNNVDRFKLKGTMINWPVQKQTCQPPKTV